MAAAGTPLSQARSIRPRARRASGASTASRYASRRRSSSSGSRKGSAGGATGPPYPRRMPATLDATAVVRALRNGVATLDALAARLGGADREELLWALEDARSRGWVQSDGGVDCGPDGLCGASSPTVYVLTPAGRAAA